MDQSVQPADDLVAKIFAIGAVLSNGATRIDPSIASIADFGTAVSGIGALTNLVNTQSAPIIPELPAAMQSLAPATAFAQIAEELQDRGQQQLATEMITEVDAGFEAYGDFMANAQLASMLSDMDNNELDARVRADDFDAIRALGFEVDVQSGPFWTGGGFAVGGTRHDVTITDGTSDLATDRIEYRVDHTYYAFNGQTSDKSLGIYDFDII